MTIEENKTYYKVIEERGRNLDHVVSSFKAPNIPDGTYSSDVLFEWRNGEHWELSLRHGIELQHDDICICDKCLNDME